MVTKDLGWDFTKYTKFCGGDPDCIVRKTMHALLASTEHPLCWTRSLHTFWGGGLQKGLLSFKNNMLITTHHTERRAHVGVWNRCLIQRSSPGLSSPARSRVRGPGTWAVIRVSESLRCRLAFMLGFASIISLFLPPESSMTAASAYSWCEVKQQQCTRPAEVSSARLHTLEEI